MSEAEADKTRKEEKRLALRDIQFPEPKNPAQRERCLRDCELFLNTYFGQVFYEPFTSDRREMMNDIISAARYGGDQSIAGPRGEGKTRLALYVALFLMLSGLSRFPIVIGKSQKKAEGELKNIKEKLQQSKLFRDDFPEIGYPFWKVGGWSSRGRMQTYKNVETNIEIAGDHLIFPTIPNLPWGSVACGQLIASMGIDGPVRGTNFRDERPTIAIIDDMEDREAANSDTLIEKNEEILEQDIAGLGASSERISRVMLCTIQNRKCIAYKYTDPAQKPSWRGKRFRKMIRQPDRMDLVEQYIEMRRGRKSDDPDAREAFRFWKERQNEIEAGAVVSNPYSYSKKIHADGEPMELSTIHAYYNRVADVGAKAVATEIDNDPPEDVGPVGSGLTAEIVASRRSGLSRRQLPMNCTALTAAIDLGKHYCHWAVVAWWPGAGGVVVDYGVVEVLGNREVREQSKADDIVASEPAIYTALLNWRDELLNKGYTDSAGNHRRVDFCLVDSGAYTRAAYEFCRQVRGPFHPSKGQSPFYPKTKESAGIIPGSNIYAAKQENEGLWLYHLDSSHWKQWVHERFLTPTFDEQNMLRKGSLSLFDADGRGHSSYSQHIVAEQFVSEFKEGKGTKTYWDVRNDNNHWLDATYMAAAASEAMGIKLLGPTAELQAVPKTDKPKPASRQHGLPRNPSGWMQRFNKRRGR